MERHREPLAALLAAVAVFVGIVAPSLMLILAVVLGGVSLAALALAFGRARQADDRRGMQNPR
jgi:Flp pilus assembly protein TadB